MDKLKNTDILREFPKIELHRHLEGTFDLEVLHRIALKNGLEVPQSFQDFQTDNQFPRDSEPNFLLFLSKFKTDWYRTHQDVYDIAYSSVKNIVKEGIFYIELRFSPEHFSLQNNFNRLDITKLVIEAGNTAAKETGLRIKYLITLNRGKQTADEMIQLYQQLKEVSPDICGFDLAGDESNFPPEKFTKFFQLLKNEKLYKATIHAGEVSPPSQIWEAIQGLAASRIGHGTSSIYDEELQKVLIKENICLEQCITSNYQTGSWTDKKTHPFGRLYRMGVPVTINSDDPSIQDADLVEDYRVAIESFDLNWDDLIKINLTAVDCCFLNPQAKGSLKKAYLKQVDEFKTKHDL